MAAALDKAPEIAPLAKRTVYMAGAFFCEGNVMPTSEFNEKYGGPQESPIDELNISLEIPHWNTTGKIELPKCCS